MKRILVTGGTGLVGKQLAKSHPNILVSSRNPDSARKKLAGHVTDVVPWTAGQEAVDLNPFEPIDAVVNLAGESVAEGRWSESKKKRIYDSRVVGTRKLVQSIKQMDRKPSVLISASAVGIYGNTGDHEVDETHASGTGFLADTCVDWEREAKAIEDAGIRLCILRIGIVMSLQGGALARMLPIFKSGLGGRLGNGRQYFPWIHIQDLVSMISWAIENENARGIYNATAPVPVTNREFTRQLSVALSRPAFLPVPAFALRLALGEFATSLFDSQKVVPQAAKRDGFKFRFNELDECLSNLFQNGNEN